MKNLVTCDKCKKIEPMRYEINYTREGSDGGEYVEPEEWVSFRKGIEEIDFCPLCNNSFVEWLNTDPNKKKEGLLNDK